jgi:peroxiredoxin
MRIGDNIPPFELKGTDDRLHDIVEYSGKPIVLVITCNHCPHARAYVQRIRDLYAKYKNQIGLFAINPNDPVQYPEDSFENMKPMATSLGINGYYLFDETQELARALGATRTPEVFLFAADGRLSYHGAIDDNEREPNNVNRHYLEDAIKAVLESKEPAVRETLPTGCSVKWRQ